MKTNEQTLRSVRWIAPLLLLTQAVGVAWVENQKWLPGTQEKDIGMPINPQAYRLITFGHLPVAIDWLWMRFMVDNRTEVHPKGEHPAIFHILNLIMDLDPLQEQIPYWASNLLAVTRKDGEGSRIILEKSLRFMKEQLPSMPPEFRERFWKRPWRIPLMLAYVHLFELENLPEAARYFQMTTEYEGAPTYLSNLSERFRRPGGLYEVGIRLMNTMIRMTSDDKVRNELLNKRESLFLSQFLFDVQMSFRTFLNEQKSYRSRTDLTESQMNQYWKQFLKENRIKPEDPRGGTLFVDASGKVRTTTSFRPVFQVEY